MSFPYLLTRLGELKIEHLQLDELTTDALRRRGAMSIALLVAELGKERYPTKEGLAAIAALEGLATVCGPGTSTGSPIGRGMTIGSITGSSPVQNSRNSHRKTLSAG